MHRTATLYILMQALNVAGGVAFATLLGSAPLSLAVPATNGSSLLANAACDWLLGERMNLRRARLTTVLAQKTPAADLEDSVELGQGWHIEGTHVSIRTTAPRVHRQA